MNDLKLEKQYRIMWQIKDFPYYKITECRNIINSKTGRILKRCVIGYSTGYWISKKFIYLNRLNEYCEKIRKEHCPF